MKFKFNDGPLLCGCGDEAIGEHDLYTGDLPNQSSVGPAGLAMYRADDPMLTSPHFFPATALCGPCLLLKVPPVAGPWHDVGARGQS